LNVREAIPDIISALSDDSSSVRLSAVNALNEMRAKEAVPYIIPLLRNKKENPSVRFRSAVALGNLNATEAVEVLIDALDDEAEEVRWGAAMAFKRIKTPKAIPALIEAVTDTSQKVSMEVIRALYYQTGKRLSSDYLSSAEEKKRAQKKWLNWWQKNRDRLKKEPSK